VGDPVYALRGNEYRNQVTDSKTSWIARPAAPQQSGFRRIPHISAISTKTSVEFKAPLLLRRKSDP
jgi:hypothetical protein